MVLPVERPVLPVISDIACTVNPAKGEVLLPVGSVVLPGPQALTSIARHRSPSNRREGYVGASEVHVCEQD